ncbi:MAG: hypothetical protein ACI88H_000771 [Cocleimonas sp.]|jgi:hypothetical protein
MSDTGINDETSKSDALSTSTSFHDKIKIIIGCFEVCKQSVEQYLKVHRSSPSLKPLTPVLLPAEDTEMFEQEMLGALTGKTGPKVRNIAVSGAYSVGKSSHLYTFQQRHQQFNYVSISLAKFINGQHSDINKTEGSSTEAASNPPEEHKRCNIERIEESIAQQLLYSAKSRDLPKSRLKRIKELSRRSALRRTFWTSLVALSGFSLVKPKIFIGLIHKFISPEWIQSNPFWLQLFNMITVTVVAFGSIYLIYWLVRLFSNSSFDSMTIKGGKVELQNHGSVLHKHLDEIVYYFERTSTGVVIFEDMDRFEETEVFNTLREINGLLNNSPQVEQAIFFIYAVKDSLFTAKERPKFFDLIIPIIPVVNSQNAKEKLTEALKNSGVSISAKKTKNNSICLNSTLVQTIAFYIDDMRLIINLTNEFNVYRNKLLPTLDQLCPNKLFAMMVVKNLHPKLHAELVERKGVLFEFFNNFESLKNDHVNELKNKINEFDIEIKRLNSVQQKSDKELRIVYWYLIKSEIGDQTISAIGFSINNSQQVNLTEEQFICGDTELNSINIFNQILSPGYSWRRVNLNFSKIKNNQGLTYPQALTLVQSDNEIIINQRLKLQKEMDEINNLNIETSMAIPSLRKRVTNVLGNKYSSILYLLSRGYLAEDYYDYLSFFYPGSLPLEDKNTLLKLRQGDNLDVYHPISKPQSLLSELEGRDLKNGQGLIIGLLTEQLKNEMNYRQTLKTTLNDAHKFISKLIPIFHFLEDKKQYTQFIKSLYEYDKLVFSALFDEWKNSGDTDSYVRLINGIFDSLTVTQIKTLENERKSRIKNHIATMPNIERLWEHRNSDTSAWSALWDGQLGIKFESLTNDISEEQIKAFIDKNLYAATYDNYFIILSKFQDAQSSTTLENVSYRKVLKAGYPNLTKQINRRINVFFMDILSPQTDLDEDKNSLLELLNIDELAKEAKEELIERCHVQIEDINSISDKTLWSLLFSAFSIENTWYNSLAYWEQLAKEKEDIDNLFAFLNNENVYKKLDASQEKIEMETFSTFISAVIFNHKLSIDAFSILLNKISLTPDFIENTTIDEEQWSMLISHKSLPYDIHIFDKITPEYPELGAEYLIHNWDKVNVSAVYEESIPFELSTELLLTQSLQLKDKMEVYNCVNDFEDASLALYQILAKMLIDAQNSNLDWVFNNTLSLEKLFEGINLTEDRVFLTIALMEKGHSSLEKLEKLFLAAKIKGFNNFFESKNIFTVDKNKHNTALLEALNKAGYLGVIKPKIGKITAYKNTSKFSSISV